MDTDKMLKKMLGSSKRRKNDWDGDGVPNRKDCQPRNPMRQDAWESKPQFQGQIKKRLLGDKKSEEYDPEYYKMIQKEHSQAKVLKCPKCGNLVYDIPGANYCDQCGFKIER